MKSFKKIYFSFGGILITMLFVLNSSQGLEFNKQQRYNTNTDFLLHEVGGLNAADPKRENTQNLPARSPQSDTQNPNRSGSVGQNPNSVNSQSSQSTVNSNVNNSKGTNNRDYVNPQFPPLGSSYGTTTRTATTLNSGTSSKQIASTPPTTSTKRDFINPNFPSLNSGNNNAQHTVGGKVKDLINFYDNKGKESSIPQKMPSYSSILQGSANNRQNFQTTKVTNLVPNFTQKPSGSTQSVFNPTPKPLSYSSVASGSSKQNTQFTTFKPSTQPIPSKPLSGPTSTSTNLGSTVLPSSIVANRNKITNQASNSNSISDVELQTLSEELLRKDINNAAKYITVNYQEKTTSQSKEDKATQPLLTVAPEVWNITTIQLFVPLLDNYERDTLVNEYVTPQERNEEIAFMDAIMNTQVIRHLMNFLKDKGHVTPDPRQQRDFLKQLWFSLYSRGKGKIGSSGFEHIFVSELKNGEVSGLHNWIYFSKEEVANRVNYLGYLKYLQLGDKGVVMKLHFTQQGVDKPVDSMFIGTSPELEIALYTLCFVMRADNECKLKLGTRDVDIVTHTFRYRSKNLIGSAYPQI